MSFTGPQTATTAQVTAATAATALFAAATNISGRYVYNASTAACFITFGAAGGQTAYTAQIAANTGFAFPLPTWPGTVSSSWTAANGTAYTTQW